MTFLNIWTREVPFVEFPLRKATRLIEEGQRPDRPAAHLGMPLKVEQEFWLLLVDMWAHNPLNRPSSEATQQRLETILCPFSSPALRARALWGSDERPDNLASGESHRASLKSRTASWQGQLPCSYQDNYSPPRHVPRAPRRSSATDPSNRRITEELLDFCLECIGKTLDLGPVSQQLNRTSLRKAPVLSIEVVRRSRVSRIAHFRLSG